MTAAAISIIIPVLNEAETLGDTLAILPRDRDLEVILVDGGSTDDTLQVAARFPQVQVLTAPRGRGRQMNTGVLASSGGLLVFLHGDTRLTAEHLRILRRVAADPAFAAGAFELNLTPPVPALRFIAWGANRRARLLGLPYGDQVLMIRRGLFLSMGGFSHRRPEDLDLVLRLQKPGPPEAAWPAGVKLRTPLAGGRVLAHHHQELALPGPAPGRAPPDGPLAGEGRLG